MILVLLVIAICGLAILSFIIFDKGLLGGGKKSGVEVIEELNSDIEKFYFYSEIYGNDEAAEKLDDVLFSANQLTIKKSNDIISVTYTKVYK